MHKIKSQTAPTMFQGKFRKQAHKYSINFSTSNYSIPPFTLSKVKYIISIEALHYGRTFLQILKKCK